MTPTNYPSVIFIKNGWEKKWAKCIISLFVSIRLIITEQKVNNLGKGFQFKVRFVGKLTGVKCIVYLANKFGVSILFFNWGARNANAAAK